ncbi:MULTISPECIES: hypothetical protein [unclassified Streptomyces]|uniref:hypothetical protein n=1 Tax=unclassified Streptomyces TaxID=2593676 RepID=UPI0037F9E68C
MAHTFEELVEKQRAADEAHARVEALRDAYGAPTATAWSDIQTDTYETAWRAWRDLARDVQAAVTEYAKDENKPRNDVEAEVKTAAKTPSTETPEAPEDSPERE